MKLTSVKNIESAMELQKEITGANYCDEFENEHEAKLRMIDRLKVKEFFISDEGDIYFIVKFEGQRILNKLQLTTSISAGAMNIVFFNDDWSVQDMWMQSVDKGDRTNRRKMAKCLTEMRGKTWAFTDYIFKNAELA